MCTLALAWQQFPETPVVAAANRDEALDRPSSPPELFGEHPRIVAPRDLTAGGTWIGLSEYGLFAAITNRWTDTELTGDRSRGQLVADALEYESAIAASRAVSDAVAEDEYDGFYLVLADDEDALVVSWDGRFTEAALEPGVHVIVNVGRAIDPTVPDHRRELGNQQASNASALREALAVDPAEGPTEWLDRAGELLGDHEYGVCVHGSSFGTRSSSLVALGTTSSYRFADGPPCRTPYGAVDLESHI